MRFWCLFVMVRMYNSLLGFGGYLVLGNELADFGTSYHPPSQCCRIIGQVNGSPVGLVVRLIYDLYTTNTHVWNMRGKLGCFSSSVNMSGICVASWGVSPPVSTCLEYAWQAGVFLLQCQHVSQMDGTPSCVFVVGEEVWD